MLYGTNKQDIKILTHPYNPTADMNGFRQVGKRVPVTATKGTPPATIKTIKQTPLAGGVATAVVASVITTKPIPYPTPAELAKKPWFLANTATAFRNPRSTQVAALFNTKENTPMAKWPSNMVPGKSLFNETPAHEGDDRAGYDLNNLKGLMDYSRRGMGSLSAGDVATLGIDWDALTNPATLSGAGSYGEGGVMDGLVRMRQIQDAYIAGQLTQQQATDYVARLAPKVVSLVETIARQGSKQATAVNWIWGAVTGEGFIKPVGGKWVPQTPPNNTSMRKPFVMPAPNSSKNFFTKANKIVEPVAKVAFILPRLTTASAIRAVGARSSLAEKALGISGKEKTFVEKVGAPLTQVAAAIVGGKAIFAANAARTASQTASDTSGDTPAPIVSATSYNLNPPDATTGPPPPGTPMDTGSGYGFPNVLDSAKNLVTGQVKSQFDQAISDPAAFARKVKGKISNAQTMIQGVTAATGGGSDIPSSGNPIPEPSFIQKNGVIMAGGLGLLFFLLSKRHK